MPRDTVEKLMRNPVLSGLMQYWPLIPAATVVGLTAHAITRPKAWSRGGKTALAIAGSAVGVTLVRWQFERFVVPKPQYEVLLRDGVFELRRYPSMLVAQTEVDLGFDEALDEGFVRLASFIFGKNHERTKVSMTSPVLTEPSAGSHVISFVMPIGARAELPTPEDARVTVRELGPRTIAALRFRGRNDGERFKHEADHLLSEARLHGLEVQGTPTFAGYDGPSTLPPLRRNEVWVEVSRS